MAHDGGAALGARALPPIDYQSTLLLGAEAEREAPKSLDEVDPKLLETYEKLGIPLHERAKLAGVAVDAVFDSVSVATTFKETPREGGRNFLPDLGSDPGTPRAGREIPGFGRTLHRQFLRDV